MSKNLRSLLGSFALLAVTFAHAQVSIIPRPQQLESQQGHFVLDRHTRIHAPKDTRSQEIAAFLRASIAEQSGITLSDKQPPTSTSIELELDPGIQGDEAYRLTVTPAYVKLAASSDKGLFWGVQTLRQLLPPAPDKTTADKADDAHVNIPAVRIVDAPAFAYRGHMLDVGRHFYPVPFIKQQIDLLSYYKLNTFRWHLTEDQGWRIEIKQYPKLTDVGAWRTEADSSRYGGFYTQEQIRDVVEYARLRGVMVIPEIEMPGHASAALAAYPELSCTKQPIKIPSEGGVFKDVLCVGNEYTFTFLQNVLDEVTALFPAPYVHIGGDEAPKDRWKDCPPCQQLMRREGLRDEEGLQSYFVKRIQRYLASKGKTMIGWDEILEGGADQSAVIEVWRGEAEGRKALANGNRIINAGPFYLDSPLLQLKLEDVYRTDPLADPAYAAHRELVWGAEAPLWSERADPLNAEAKLYPRLQAFAEMLWSAGKRDDAAYADFRRRLQAHYHQLDAWQIAYGPEDRNLVEYEASLNPQRDGWRLHARRGFDDLQNHYTINGDTPDQTSLAFTDELNIRTPGVLKIAPFRHDRPYEHAHSFTLVQNLALGKPIRFATPPHPRYSKNSATALVDGVLGSDDFKDGTWLGWQGANLDATIDLQQAHIIHSISIGFLQQESSWIRPPKRVTFETSDDGRHWQRQYTSDVALIPSDSTSPIRGVEYTAEHPLTARFIRVIADRYGKFNNNESWTFADEILVH
ncbi:family 20 glycosylhydrolase [Dyella tabacisoli]|uniref:glycoside hydrolase family 20 protein n=1 Tax=Dyella tabacisoli TaxID=2282381 RepID=UPI0013B43929|nr:family 20 glycosylhydrolase [Dyella tabacisoli]